jgi:hypothetical protein
MQALTFPAFLTLLWAQAAAQEPTFLRLARDEAGRITALETAIVRYERGAGAEKVTLDAVGAIHMADAAYYDALNERFKQYDALCYELVASREAAPTPKSGNDLYGLLGSLLGLEGQTAGIDYAAANFVHADMTIEALQEKMDERGDDALTLALSSAAEMLRARNREARKRRGAAPAPAEPSLEELLAGPVQMKRSFADGLTSSMNGSGLGAQVDHYLIHERNEAAMKVVDEQIARGRKRLGLFYGAAHFPDFHKRLRERGFAAVETTWQRAWDLSRPTPWDFSGLLKKILEFSK